MKEHPIIFSGDMVIKIMTCAKCGHISVPFPCENCGCRYRRIGQQPGEFQIDFDGTENNWSKLNPRFFLRWACRLKLKVKSNRAERVQEITRDDVYAEGLQNTGEGWDVNPWVWVAEFERAEMEK